MFFKGVTETFSEWIKQLFKVHINANKLLAQQTRVGVGGRILGGLSGSCAVLVLITLIFSIY